MYLAFEMSQYKNVLKQKKVGLLLSHFKFKQTSTKPLTIIVRKRPILLAARDEYDDECFAVIPHYICYVFIK